MQNENAQEDKLLQSRVGDAFGSAARYVNRFFGFLDPHERAVARQFAKRLEHDPEYDGCSYAFWGGYDEAERAFFGVFPPYEEPSNEKFPIAAIDITWRFAALTHRDFLGALLALGIVRGKIGDIVTGDGRCTVFAEKTVAAFVVQNLTKVGRVGVSCSLMENPLVVREDNFTEIGCTVASSRLDCIVSALVGESRSASAELIEKGLVSVEFESCCNISSLVNEGATVSIRGHGRFVVDRIGPQTKKGRYTFKARKFR